MSAIAPDSRRCAETRAHNAHQWVSPPGSATGFYVNCPGGPNELHAAHVAAERDALLAKFEALAAEFHVAVISAGVEGDYAIGYGNGMAAARNALSNVIRKARA